MWILCVFFNNTYCLLFLYYLLNVFSFFISINKIIWIMNEILFKTCCVLTIYRYSVDTVTSQRTPWCLHASSLNLSLPLHRKDMSYLTAPTDSNSIVKYLTALQRRPHFVYTSCLSVRTPSNHVLCKSTAIMKVSLRCWVVVGNYCAFCILPGRSRIALRYPTPPCCCIRIFWEVYHWNLYTKDT